MSDQRVPKVSIGLAVRNGEAFLGKVFGSLLHQSFADFELIISDNASTDATAAICRDFAEHDPRIVYVRQSENIGAYENLNVVMRLARGTYFMWGADDDWWSENWIETMLAGLDDETALCFGEVAEVEYDGRVRQHRLLRAFSRQKHLRVIDCYLRERWEAGVLIYGLIRTALVLECRLNPDYGLTADQDFIAQVAHHGQIKLVKGAKFYKRNKVNQHELSWWDKAGAYLENLKYLFDPREHWRYVKNSPDPLAKVGLAAAVPVKVLLGLIRVHVLAARQVVGGWYPPHTVNIE